LAGRSLDRALKKLHSNHNKSSSSLKSMSSEVIHADNASRPGTPGTEPPMSSAILEQLKGIQNAYAAAKSDNAFLRSLVEQNTKEKAVLVTAVETLQVQSKSKSLYIQYIFGIGLLGGRKHAWRSSMQLTQNSPLFTSQVNIRDLLADICFSAQGRE